MRLKIDWASLFLGRKFTVFLRFTLYLRAIFKVQATGGLIFGAGDLTEGFFAFQVLGAYIWRGLHMEGLIFGILRCGAEVWQDIPACLSDKLESVQRRALSIIYPSLSYADALISAQTTSLALRKSQLSMKYLQKLHSISRPNNFLPPSSSGHSHDYNLRTKTTSSYEAFWLIYYLQSSIQFVNAKSSSIYV